MYSYSDGGFGAGLYSAEETPENTKISSWSFSIDGHQFIFLHLGIQGTYVFDAATGNWMSWLRGGSVGLGLSDGQSFNEFNLMGSLEDGTIYTFDPNELDDYDGPFTTTVTSGFPAKGGEQKECFIVYLEGNRSDKTDRSVTLLTSDDNGKTWQTQGVITPSADDDLLWRSLGLIKAPGRMFEINDTGVLKSIDSLSMEGRG